MSLRRLITATAATAAVTAMTAAPAVAGPKLSVVGLGTVTGTDAGGLSYEADPSASPLEGHVTGGVRAADGSLPAVGQCEPATGTLTLEDDRGRWFRLVSSGEVCSIFLPLGTMQNFRGRWVVEDTSERRLARATGVMDLRFLNGQADLYATS